MKIDIVTLFPSLYDSFVSTSIIKKSLEKKLFSFSFFNYLNFAKDKKRIDTPVVGHGDGMLLGVDIINSVFEKSKEQNSNKKPYTIFFSPHGKKINQNILKNIYDQSKKRNLLLFSGRYEGFDYRAEEKFADEILSIGDYVLMGGDLPIMIFLEGLLRLIPGVIGKERSVNNDSFQKNLVDYPSFGLPKIWNNKEIPEVLFSGNHSKINEWRENEAIKRTLINNFSWWRSSRNIEKKELKGIKKNLPNHYCLLLHNDVMMPNGEVGSSSVTSIDIHDIARSSATYGIKKFFVITRIEAQKKLVEKFLSFWQCGKGAEYNQNRSFAIERVFCYSEIEYAIEKIEEVEGKKPICIVTSSRREIGHSNMITYNDQGSLWVLNRPILFIFGTAHGISPKLMEKIEYRLLPIEGFEEFNFLSVRSAAAIIFDRWLGLNPI